MLRRLIIEKDDPDQLQFIEDIFSAIKSIQSKLEDEVASKQKTIEGSWEEIRKLRAEISKKELVIESLENRILDYKRGNDGNRQLINKLLNDLERAQQDIEWYKRTYERRSLLGVVKDRIKFLFVNKK